MNEQENAQNTAIHIFNLRSATLDIDKLSYDEVLPLLLTSIYIYRLASTRSKAHRINKVCREKVRQEAGPSKEGGNGGNNENYGIYCKSFLGTD